MEKYDKMKWERVVKEFEKIKKELGNPPVILLRPSEWERQTNIGVNAYWGRITRLKVGLPARIRLPTKMTLRYRNLSLVEVRKTIYHEIAHTLFPSKPHWWIELYAYKMVGNKGSLGWYAMKYNHKPSDIPSRKILTELSKKASKRLKKFKA